jgi:hypothetical protein
MARPTSSADVVARQRAAARRTAITIGGIAIAIYVAFILRGVLSA